MKREYNYYTVIRMQPSGFRGEVINIGILLFDAQKKRHRLEILPPAHPKIQSVALKGMKPFDYDHFIELLTESIQHLDDDGISPFEREGSSHSSHNILNFLKEQHFIKFSTLTHIRTGADLDMVIRKMMESYVE